MRKSLNEGGKLGFKYYVVYYHMIRVKLRNILIAQDPSENFSIVQAFVFFLFFKNLIVLLWLFGKASNQSPLKKGVIS